MKRMTNEAFQLKVAQSSPNVILLSQYERSGKKVNCRCRTCGYEWSTVPCVLLRGDGSRKGGGCPKCANRVKKTNAQFVTELKDIRPSIILESEYLGANKPIRCRCAVCGYTWETTPHVLLKPCDSNCPKNMYGYVRVSTKDQNLDRQLLALDKFGIPEALVFKDKMSGKDFERPAYLLLLEKLKPGDTLVIKSIDRLGRNYDEILEQWRILTKEKKVDIVVIDMPLLDTRQGRDLTGTLIADIVLQLLSYVAQTEREYIRQRQAEGIAAARARGVRLGRSPKRKPENYSSVFNDWESGMISARAASKQLGVDRKTFSKWINQSVAEKSTPFPPF